MTTKLLIWTKTCGNVWTAPAFFGRYRVVEHHQGCGVTWEFGHACRTISDVRGTDLATATQLAQTDFRELVLSALVA